MICEECGGKGVVPKPYWREMGLCETCPACGGTGIAHCCDGPVGRSHEVAPDVFAKRSGEDDEPNPA